MVLQNTGSGFPGKQTVIVMAQRRFPLLVDNLTKAQGDRLYPTRVIHLNGSG